MGFSIFDPRVIFLISWISQIILQALDSTFYSFEYVTWVAVISAIVAFLCGAKIGMVLPYSVGYFDRPCIYSDNYIKKSLVVLFCLYVVALVVAIVNLIGLLGGLDVFNGPASNLRMALVNDFLGERLIFQYLRVFYFGVGLSLFALSFASRLSRTYVVLIILVGLISAIATTGRLYLLLFVVAGSVLLYRQKIISNRGLSILGGGFVLLFFCIAFILDKGDTGSSIVDSISWNAKTYFMSSLACFNDYVRTGAQEIPGGAIIPGFIRPLLNQIGFSLGAKPELLPFAYVPEPCNTYTVLFPYFHDFDLVGVTVFMFVIGIIHQYLYKIYQRTQSPLKWYLFSISLYPLVMMIFEEAYVSSIGFWFMLLILPFGFAAVHRFGKSRFIPVYAASMEKG